MGLRMTTLHEETQPSSIPYETIEMEKEIEDSHSEPEFSEFDSYQVRNS